MLSGSVSWLTHDKKNVSENGTVPIDSSQRLTMFGKHNFQCAEGNPIFHEMLCFKMLNVSRARTMKNERKINFLESAKWNFQMKSSRRKDETLINWW